MKEIEIIPSSITSNWREYFQTVKDDTVLYAPGIGPCIAGLFYRKGHLGLGHFDPMMDSVLEDISHIVKKEMEKEGTGNIGCRLFTGVSFAAREEFQRDKGIAMYHRYIREINNLGFNFNERGSRTYILANNGPALLIGKIQAKLTGKDLEKVEVRIEYMRRDQKETVEEFEIDIENDQTRVIQAFTEEKLY
ncbi:MAG: hypothetical protein Q8R18_00070 [bacterium]|nr:hypothetical protein [bacterium]